MEPFEMTPDARFAAGSLATATRMTGFLKRVDGWMFVGLALTGLIAAGMAQNPETVIGLARKPILFFGLIIAELGLVVYLSRRALKMSAAAATGSFLLYAGLNGV